MSTRLPEMLDCSFKWGLRTPNLGEGEAVGGSGMVPFERALVSFYRSSMLPFPLSLRVSEILPLLFSSMPVFPYPTSSLPQISPCSPGNRWIAFWLQRAKVLGQVCVQLVFKISNLCDHKSPTSQTDGQTDRRTDGRTDDMRSQYRAFALKCIAR